MSLVIDDPEVEALIQQLGNQTGQDAASLVRAALHEKANRVEPSLIVRRRAAIRRFQEKMAKLPILDTRSADEIIGYNEYGLFD